LERLLAVSASLNETADTSELLQHVCAAISEALGFEKVAVQLLSEQRLHTTAAAVGFADGENIGAPITPNELERLLQREFDVSGCYLVPHEEARQLLPDRPVGYRSQ